MKWTDSQQKVIDNRNSNLLVSAAAGSGKTAVLVEHIIRQILDKDKHIDVDRLMVVTFTNAAAGEMKERILAAIENELRKDCNNIHLQKQMAYIHNAKITTLHSFCLNLVREHFNLLDIDPGFRVGDPGEIALIKADVAKEVIEAFYGQEKEEFHEFVEQISPDGKDGIIEELIQNFYSQAMSSADPKTWINDTVSYYDRDDLDIISGEQLAVIDDYIDMLLTQCVKMYNECLSLIAEDEGPKQYEKNITEEFTLIKDALAQTDYVSKTEVIKQITFGRLSPVKKDDVNELVEQVKSNRDSVKKIITDISTHYCFGTQESLSDTVKKLSVTIHEYGRITLEFMKQYLAKKKELNVLDFDDFEHFAIKILTEKIDGKLVPSKAADEIAKSIDEVIIDEYQDINEVQDTILQCLSTERFGRPDMFMVGDVKQSIYGFRKANPELFIKKYNTYSAEDETNRKIVLKQNFRSRKEVLESVNYIFRRSMYSEFGGIEYDDENALYLGADYPKQPEGQSGNTEILLAEVPNEIKNDSEDGVRSGLSRKEIEAKMVSGRIKELTDIKNGYEVFDRKTGEYRKARYSDILVLFRSTKGNADILMDELTSQGIPCYFERQTGYFDALEVREILEYLSIIDNPHQDIPLAATLKSMFGMIDDSDLAVIRAVSTERNDLYSDVINYIETHDNELADKLDAFINKFMRYRKMSLYTSICELITNIIEETGYDEYVMALPAGERRSANISMLKEKALEYENGSYKGLFNFVRYIEKIKKYEIDSGEASTVSGNENVVNIMSIHKSKGLEYPIVFICNINGQFNMMDSKQRVLIHKKLGVGLDYIDKDTRIKEKCIYKSAIAIQQQIETKQEELRILYVAMTRAKEKLIITGSGISDSKYKDYLAQRLADSEHVEKIKLIKSASLMDVLGYSLGSNRCFKEIYELFETYMNPSNRMLTVENNTDVRYVQFTDTVAEKVKENVLSEQLKENLSHWDSSFIYSDEVNEHIKEQLEYKYPFAGAVNNYAKLSVSDLKHKSMEEDEECSKILEDKEVKELIPEFVIREKDDESKQLYGAARGTAYHRVFELFDFTKELSKENITPMLENMVNENKLDETSLKSVNTQDIFRFSQSSLASRMQKAHETNNLYREAQFVMGIDGEEIYDASVGTKVLIQGIIDVYFIEDGEIVLADYKTDRVHSMDELVKRYSEQLKYYKIALEQITRMKVKEVIIYSVTLGEEGKVEV